MMKFAIRSARYSPYAPYQCGGYPYFRKVGVKSFKWCGSLQEAFVFSSFEEIPKTFKTPSGRKLSKRYRLVVLHSGRQEQSK